MSNATHVKTVTLTIELDNGDYFKMAVHEPEPRGGNPRYIGMQVAKAIEELDRRADDLMQSQYGSQVAAAR